MAATGTAAFRGPVCRMCRREMAKLFLKGDKCYTAKCPVSKRTYPPGQHGMKPSRKMSDYGVQLREKQKTRRIYRVMESQFHGYFEQAAASRGVTGEVLLQKLETRLDNVIYRLAIAASRSEARQLVVHRHILVNGHVTNIPSRLLREGDVVEVAEKSKQIGPIARMKPAMASRGIPPWIQFDSAALKATVLRAPTREEIDTDVQEALIVEFYSR